MVVVVEEEEEEEGEGEEGERREGEGSVSAERAVGVESPASMAERRVRSFAIPASREKGGVSGGEEVEVERAGNEKVTCVVELDGDGCGVLCIDGCD